MEDREVKKSNSLIKSKKSIFVKIKERIQLLIKKDELKKIDSQWLEDFRKIHQVKETDKTTYEKINKYEKIDINDIKAEYDMFDEFEEDFYDDFENETENIEDKNQFFELYNKIKESGEVPNNISTKDLLRINEMLKQEIGLKKKKYRTEEFEKVEDEIKILEKENEELTKKLKKIEGDAEN